MIDERIYLTYILDCISNIQELASQGQEILTKAKHDKAAVLYYLHTMAEATQRLSEETKATKPEISWEAIGGFRNRLVHGYLDVNWEIIWGIIHEDLPPLKAAVEVILKQQSGKSGK